MNTCPDCKNDLVCHDQGECLRPTPETAAEYKEAKDFQASAFVEPLERFQDLERQLVEARQAFAIATDQLVQVQGELRQVREELQRLRKELDGEPWETSNDGGAEE